MKKFFEIFGRGIVVALIAVGVIGGLGGGIWYLDKSLKEFRGKIEVQLIDHQAQVDINTYGTKMAAYMRVCTNLEVPAQVCILAFPGKAVK